MRRLIMPAIVIAAVLAIVHPAVADPAGDHQQMTAPAEQPPPLPCPASPAPAVSAPEMAAPATAGQLEHMIPVGFGWG